MSDGRPGMARKPLRGETWLFGAGVFFFGPIGVLYALLTANFRPEGMEPAGTVALFLLAGLSGLVGIYLGVVGRRIDPRPEDDPFGDVETNAGEIGVFSPWSWWPLVLGIATALTFLGLAVGWWLVGIGVVLGLIGLSGQLFEFSRGQHAH